MGFKILKIDLTKKEAIGKMVFDSVKGRLVMHELGMPIAGAMTLEVQGMTVDLQLDGHETRTMRLMDKRPSGDV